MASDMFSEKMLSTVTGIKFDVLSDEEMKKFSVISIVETNDVTDAKLGVPNPSSWCSTCNSETIKDCDGHFGVINLPATIYHPHFVSEIVRILNNVCPGCKSVRKKQRNKGSGQTPKNLTLRKERLGCKYCVKLANSIGWYPKMKFKLASENSSGRYFIKAEVSEKLPKKFRRKKLSEALPRDYWDFIPNVLQGKKYLIPYEMDLSPYQVFCFMKEIDPKFIQKFVSRREVLLLNFLPITPNSHRVIETIHFFGNRSNLFIDERTVAYQTLAANFKKLVKERGPLDTIPSSTAKYVVNCLNVSKLLTKESSSMDSSRKSGSKWIKEVVLGKRTDYSFRLTVVGDPKIKLGEIGMSCDISEKLLIPVHVTSWNLERLNKCYISRKDVVNAQSKGDLIPIRTTNKLRIGDIIYRPLEDGDLVLINRPPTVHQHSLIAFSVKVLAMKSVVSINPLCCAPLRGDFDGDCLHGYIPQSINCRVELGELVSLDHQLFNGQDGRNLLSLNQDSLTAAHLVVGSEVFLNRFQMQQFEMLCPHQVQWPAIVKAPLLQTPLWTGKQLLSMLLPQCFDFEFASNMVEIRVGETLSCSNESAWLRNTSTEIFLNLFKKYQSKALDFLCAAQEVLCEWISSRRGLSVSLADIYLSSDSYSRTKMVDDVNYALQEAERRCLAKQLLVDWGVENLFKQGDVNQDSSNVKNRKPSSVKGVSESSFKEVFRDLQNVIRQYASKDNSLFAMVNAGSKGSLIKLVQQGACLGLQRAPKPLSFRIPSKLSCAEWNQQKVADLDKNAQGVVNRFGGFSYGVVENSFISGLNPLECFIHAVSSRGNCFSENANVPGTLNRKLMFYMRDLYAAYDGTVRSSYGNQVIQFSYEISEDKSIEGEGFGGQPVGAWAACAISEAAYGALDQPINDPDTSPLLNLKKVFDCGLKQTNAGQTMSLYLSQKLRRFMYGFEYGAIAVKNHLERVLFSDVISTVLIIFSKQVFSHGKTKLSPWVSHFHICKERLKERRLNVQSIIDALSKKYNSMRRKRNSLPKLFILSGDCALDEEMERCGMVCISLVAEISESAILLDILKDLVPILLTTVIKGFVEFEKVDILSDDHPKTSNSRKDSFGELFLKVYISKTCEHGKFWSVLQNACIQIMDLIDWERSHPDNVYDIFNAFGIDAAWKYFLRSLKVTLSEVGRDIHLKHLLIVADCLSITGEFHGLNAKGIKRQRDQMSISSPFMRACFSNPSSCFIKASKEGTVDGLSGTLDAVAWGKKAPIGTWAPFDILYSGKGHNIVKSEGIYETLCNQLTPHGDDMELQAPVTQVNISDNLDNQSVAAHDDKKFEKHIDLECKLNSNLRRFNMKDEIVKFSNSLRSILNKYPMNGYLNEADKSILMEALHFHPRRKEKLGTGPQEIKIGCNPAYPESRCFMLVREDGTSEDFSYRKCVEAALSQFYNNART